MSELVKLLEYRARLQVVSAMQRERYTIDTGFGLIHCRPEQQNFLDEELKKTSKRIEELSSDKLG